MRYFKARLALVAVAAVGVIAAGVAYAAWTGPGQGEGYGKATRWQMLTTDDASARLVGDLYPGGRGDLAFEWHNPNPFAVRITEIRLAGPIEATPPDPNLTCNPSTIEYTPPATFEYDVGPDQSALFIIDNGLSMDVDADDGCQGASFTLPVVARGIIIIGT